MKDEYNLPLSKFEIILQVLSGMIILSITIPLILKYSDLPETIPINYNTMGEVNDWGRKSTVLLLYGVSLVLYFGLTILERYPHLYNYPVSINNENKNRQYQLARSLITTLKLSTSIIFMLIIASPFRDQTENSTILMGSYFIVFVLGITFIPIIVYFVLSFKNK